MPKKIEHPRLRVHVRKGKGGQVWSSWYYDRRPDGLPDEPLGSDYAEALKRWDEIHNERPRMVGTIMEAMLAWEKERLDDLETRYESEETRKGYRRQLANIKPVFGKATWDAIALVDLKAYLKKRTAKTQGNRELAVLSIVWNYARGEGFTKLPFPAAGMEKSKWKNKEHARKFEVTDALFTAVYKHADQTLQDCMDLASATGMRLTDCRTILLPASGILHLDAEKTGKGADFELDLSAVLPALVARRRARRVDHLMLLSTPTGRPLSARMLYERWCEARAKAVADPANKAIKDAIAAMWNRDMRKYAADLAGDEDEASRLLQHSSVAVTRKHYRTKATKLRPVR